MAQRFSADRTFFSVKGIEIDGSLTDPDALEAGVKRAMIGRARTVVLVADSHKFDEHGLNVVVPAGATHVAYLAGGSTAGQKLFREAGVELHLV
jgi:DeoR/GlpR family transcriptional regulator of sugar metabolism